MDVILISGLPASGKTTVAKMLAEKLGFSVVGGSDALKELAKTKGYKPIGNDWWDTSEGIKFLKERASDPEFDMETDKKLIELLKKGKVVVTSYTLPWLVDLGFRVWLDADLETRAKRMAERDHISIDEAKKVIEIRDAENRDLYEKLYGIKFGEDLSPFDIVIDVNEATPEQIVEKIIKEIKNRESSKEN